MEHAPSALVINQKKVQYTKRQHSKARGNTLIPALGNKLLFINQKCLIIEDILGVPQLFQNAGHNCDRLTHEEILSRKGDEMIRTVKQEHIR